MNVVINSQRLLKELRLVTQAVSDKPILPVLHNVLLRAEENKLHFFATDIEIGLLTSCVAHVEQPGAVTLPAKRLLEIVEQLTSGDVRLTLDKTNVSIAAGAFKSRLQTLPASDFPPPPVAEGDVTSLSAKDLHGAIKKIRFAIGEKITKYVLNGALLSFDTREGTAPTAALVATDTKHLSLAMIPHEGMASVATMVSKKTLDLLLSQLDSGTVDYSQNDHSLFFVIDHRLLFANKMGGKFPNYGKIIPQSNDNKAVVDREAFAAALRRVGLVADENKATFFTFEPHQLTIAATNVEIGDADEQLAIEYDGPPIKLCAIWTHFSDFLKAAEGPTVTVALKDANSAVLLRDGEQFLNVVMTMRV